ncbi:MAG: hypothetical protein LBR27_11685 [Bifidobacteriaceae bacterium]|jgi:hypothetical protein|nr:hypothetical protein [Bifidobacteriaceae bacterium]
MTASAPPAVRPDSAELEPTRAVAYAMLLTLTFVVAHAGLFWLSLGPLRPGSNDVSLYAWWMYQGDQDGIWQGLNVDWVYPVGALIPMVIPQLLSGGNYDAYLPLWCTMVALMNALTCLVTVSFAGLKRACLPLVWWLVFLLLLGPVALTRLDAIAMPLVLMALLVAASLPGVAAILLTIGAWIKVSPGVIVLPLFAVVKRRLYSVALPAAITCVFVVLLHWLASGSLSLSRLFSFVGAETGRGLQVESVLATAPVLLHAIKGEIVWEYNDELSTVETYGGLADGLAGVGDIAMWVAVACVGGLTFLARHRATEALLTGSLATMTAMIVLHKVGSPQFIAWLAPAVVVALIVLPTSRLWALLSIDLLLISGLTLVIYPWGYYAFLEAQPAMLLVYVVRNGLLVMVFGLALWKLWKLAAPGRRELLGRLARR